MGGMMEDLFHHYCLQFVFGGNTNYSLNNINLFSLKSYCNQNVSALTHHFHDKNSDQMHNKNHTVLQLSFSGNRFCGTVMCYEYTQKQIILHRTLIKKGITTFFFFYPWLQGQQKSYSTVSIKFILGNGNHLRMNLFHS